MVSLFQYIKDKFDPTRPMGRKNFFWTNFIYRLIVVVLVFLFSLFYPLWNASVQGPLILLVLVDAPCILLAFRRARAARVHFSFVYIAGLLSIVYALLSRSIPLVGVSNLIVGYNLGLSLALIIMKNKIEPVTP